MPKPRFASRVTKTFLFEKWKPLKTSSVWRKIEWNLNKKLKNSAPSSAGRETWSGKSFAGSEKLKTLRFHSRSIVECSIQPGWKKFNLVHPESLQLQLAESSENLRFRLSAAWYAVNESPRSQTNFSPLFRQTLWRWNAVSMLPMIRNNFTDGTFSPSSQRCCNKNLNDGAVEQYWIEKHSSDGETKRVLFSNGFVMIAFVDGARKILYPHSGWRRNKKRLWWEKRKITEEHKRLEGESHKNPGGFNRFSSLTQRLLSILKATVPHDETLSSKHDSIIGNMRRLRVGECQTKTRKIALYSFWRILMEIKKFLFFTSRPTKPRMELRKLNQNLLRSKRNDFQRNLVYWIEK